MFFIIVVFLFVFKKDVGLIKILIIFNKASALIGISIKHKEKCSFYQTKNQKQKCNKYQTTSALT